MMDFLQKLDEYAESHYRDWLIPGMAVAVIKDDEIVFAKGYGVRDINTGVAVDEQSVFAIGSASKAFTATVLAMLVDEGKLKWDDKVTEYLPYFQLYDPYVTKEFTVRDLLVHRSGLARSDFLWYSTGYDREEIVKRVRHVESAYSFRAGFGYQNVMYLAAGQVAAAITGKSWDDLIKERIFLPLGMSNSYTSVTELEGLENQAYPHLKSGDKAERVNWRNIDNVAPAGSINSNVIDMAQWVRLNLGGGKYAGKELIGEANIKQLHGSQHLIPLDSEFITYYNMMGQPNLFTYGLGWFVFDYKGEKYIWHGGAIDGMYAQVAFFPAQKLGIVALSNLSGGQLVPVLPLALHDFHSGASETHWHTTAREVVNKNEAQLKETTEKQDKERASDTKPSLILAQYAGEYENQAAGIIKVALEEENLVLTLPASAISGELQHWHYDTFRFFARDKAMAINTAPTRILVNFKLGADGKVAELNHPLVGDFKRLP
jgi:CubicO group peptidase (beta-lactamase class C family)